MKHDSSHTEITRSHAKSNLNDLRQTGWENSKNIRTMHQDNSDRIRQSSSSLTSRSINPINQNDPSFLSAPSILLKPTAWVKEQQVQNTVSTQSSTQSKNELPKKLVRRDWNNSTTISLMPSMHFLELSSHFLDSDFHEPNVIMKNLSDCFRVLSLWVKYDNKNAGAALLSPERVEMYVCLWNVDFGRKICIEIQRRRGDSDTFHKYAKHILDASSGDFHSHQNMTHTSYIDSNYFKQSEIDTFMEINHGNESEKTNILLIPVDHVLMLLNDGSLDSRILGLESLYILSDVKKATMSMAHHISRCILFREDGNRYGNIHDTIFHIIQKQCMPDEDKILAEIDFDDDSDDEEYYFDNQDQNMNKPPEYQEAIMQSIMYGLTILANCLEVIFILTSNQNDMTRTEQYSTSGSSCISMMLQAAMDCTDADLLRTLMEYVGQGDSQPHHACEAVRCLTLICRLSLDARNQLLKQGVFQIVVNAQRIGFETHFKLEKESTELLQVLCQTF